LNRHHRWLPDRHLGVAATLTHADDVIGQAADIPFDYQSQPDGIIRLEERPAATYSETIVTGMAPIPRKVPLLVADALVALRNAIEHVIFTEVEHCDGALDKKSARLVEMPAAMSFDDFQEWISRRQKNGPSSLLRGSELVRRIEGLHPYQRTSAPQEHPMALLALHTNHSKHRAPALTAVRLAAIQREDQSPPSMADVQRLPEVPLQTGDVIARTPRGVYIPVALFPTIGINRPGTDRWPVLMKELEDLSSWVRAQAIPRLVTGVEPPSPALPARYDIFIGHDDERNAISAGSNMSAAERHQQRLQAASVRQNMIDILADLDGAPSHEQLAAWLNSLDDQQALALMSNLRLVTNYEPSILRSNHAALEAMLEDAWHYTGDRS